MDKISRGQYTYVAHKKKLEKKVTNLFILRILELKTFKLTVCITFILGT